MNPKITYEKGSPQPLGISYSSEGINFSLFSQEASAVKICFFYPGEMKPFTQFELSSESNKSGHIWHLLVKQLPKQVEYGYKIQKNGHWSNLLIDPYARSLNLSAKWKSKWKSIRGRVLIDLPFDWEDDKHPYIPMEELIIYEMHVRGFTKHTSSGVECPGSYLGIIEKIPYFLDLGVNAIELMPIHVFDEMENHFISPVTHKSLCNFWGYSPINYFSLMNRYATESRWGEEIQQFKKMVKLLHRAGIEVILDVVFNHTSEGEKNTLSFPWD